MKLTQKQINTKDKIKFFAEVFGIDPSWAISVAMVESSLGLKQKSPTGCLGVFQMSNIAMKDLRQLMEVVDDDLIDISCGVAFLKLLLKRWKTMEEATRRFCDPKDRDFYLDKVRSYMNEFEKENKTLGIQSLKY